MGVAPSQSMESLSDNVCIAALVSRSPVTREALWNELFDSFEYPSCCLSPAHLEFLTKMGDIFRENDITTRNFSRLVRHTIELLQHEQQLHASTNNEEDSASERQSGRLVKALFLVRLFMQYFIEHDPALLLLHLSLPNSGPLASGIGGTSSSPASLEELLASIAITPSSSTSGGSSSSSPASSSNQAPFLVAALFDFIVARVTLVTQQPNYLNRPSKHPLLVFEEVLDLLLLLTSSKVLLPLGSAPILTAPLHESMMLHAKNTALASTTAGIVMGSLLQHWMKAPPHSIHRYYLVTPNDSYLSSIGTAASTVLLFPLRLLFPASPSRGRVADTPTTTGSVVPPGMLGFESASSSALFLAACLAHHPHNDGPSVFLKALYEFQDSEFIDKEQQQTNASTDNSALPVHRPWRISFAGLFDALAKNIRHPLCALLLRDLVYGNKAFRLYLFSRSDIDTLLLPMLQTIYEVSLLQPSTAYTLLISLITLTSDTSFARTTTQLILPTVPWIFEQLLTLISLADLIAIALTRVALWNMTKHRDLELQRLCLATLVNVFPHCEDMHSYTAQRFVRLFEATSKRYNSALQRAGGVIYINTPEACMYAEFMQYLIEALHQSICNGINHKHRLIYALLYNKPLFTRYLADPRFSALSRNIHVVIEYFSGLLDKEDMDSLSADVVVDLISKGMLSWKNMLLVKEEGDTVYQYVEESTEAGQEFYSRTAWQAIVVRRPFWCEAHIQAAGLIEPETHKPFANGEEAEHSPANHATVLHV